MRNNEKSVANFNRARSAKVLFLVIAFVAVIGFSMTGCTTTTSSRKEPIYGVTYNIAIPAKNIQIVGIVRVEKKVDTYGNGELITYDALLKEAEAVGGNGIVNIMIDRLEKITSTTTTDITSTVTNMTWYGSALAIKFTNENLPPDTPMSTSTGNLIIYAQNDSISTSDSRQLFPAVHKGIRQ